MWRPLLGFLLFGVAFFSHALETESQLDEKSHEHTDKSQQSSEKPDIKGHIAISAPSFSLDDSNWKIVWHASTDTELLNAPDMVSVLMTTKENERYDCKMSVAPTSPKDDMSTYAGPNPLQLLQPLFAKMACSYRLESYWTYELCHGHFIRQFHEVKDGKQTKLTEFFLGRYGKEALKEDIAAMEAAIADGTVSRHPKTLRLEELELPYLEVTYTGGTVCDLTQRPRETRVRYVCHANGRHELVSFQEVSSCQYVIVVLTPLLCSHPEYRVTDDIENSIHCIALANSPKRPKSLLELEAESLKLRHHHMVKDEVVEEKVVSARVTPVDDDDTEEGEEDEDTTPATAAPGTSRERPKSAPIYDEKLVDDFLAGRHCLYGGSGWWRYEFCYGKRVDQFHVEKDGTKTTIHLGFFDLGVHKEWLEVHPQKKPKPVGSRRHVSHFYSGGSLCDLTDEPRSVEVKLKCKVSDSPNAVSLYLLEPKSCEYILGVESPIICALLDKADESGLMTR